MDFLTLATGVFGILMSLSWFLQAWQIYKLKSSKELNPYFLAIFFLGILLWLVYGIFQQDAVIILSFAVGFVGISSLVFLYFRYR